MAEFERIVREKKLEKKVRVEICGCFGFCEKGPIVKIFPEGIFRLSVHAGVKNIGIYLRPFSSPLDCRRYRVEILKSRSRIYSQLSE